MRLTLRFIFIGLQILLLSGCGIINTTPVQTPSSTCPAPTLSTPVICHVPTPENTPLSTPSPAPTPTGYAGGNTSITLSNKHYEEKIENPRVDVKVDYPFISDHPQSELFNKHVMNWIDTTYAQFMNDAINNEEIRKRDIPDFSNYFQITYRITNQTPSIISVLFYFSFYVAGAAHGNTITIPVNFSMKDGRILSLADIFSPGSKYLDFLSQYSITYLKQNGSIDFEEGAAPKVENFKSWNFAPEGLVITFDPYQVAAYAAGIQTVYIPWLKMNEMIIPDYFYIQ